jgi:geranylgeranyl diphosphate synthase type II
MTSFDLDEYRKLWKPRIDAALSEILDDLGAGCPDGLLQAMRHAVLGGGKRLRPILCLAAARACGGEERAALRPGCALELIHAYSLVHDDLPAMDDDDVRRGRPACHKAFGEALAILAGDALLTYAFAVLARSVPAPMAQAAVVMVARAAGPLGMVGGQADDVGGEGLVLSVDEIERIHSRKTAALFQAAVGLGGLLAGAAREQLDALSAYGRDLGMAYQVADDLLAHTGDQQTLERPAGSDRAKNKPTHPVVAGADASRERAAALVREAVSALGPLGGRAEALRAIADFVQKRAWNP